jgi:pre-mRNA-splicing factor ISY1
VTEEFLHSIKELFDKVPDTKKRRSRYVICKKIDAISYSNNDDKDSIMDKVERPMEEEMQARALRDSPMIESI